MAERPAVSIYNMYISLENLSRLSENIAKTFQFDNSNKNLEIGHLLSWGKMFCAFQIRLFPLVYLKWWTS